MSLLGDQDYESRMHQTLGDISLGVSLGSATQISAFVIPLCDIVRWIMGVPMDLDFGRLQSASLAFAIVLTSLTDGTQHYLIGVVLCLAYVVLAACFNVSHGTRTKLYHNLLLDSVVGRVIILNQTVSATSLLISGFF
ncbi:hypothetical protein ACET3Z_021813 [Daucus carota]